MFKQKFSFPIIFIFSIFFSSCGNFQEVSISKIENLKILNFSSDGIEVGLGITIKNPNAVGFSVYSTSFDVKLNDVFIGTASIKNKVNIKGHSEEVQNFVFQSDLSQLNIMALPKILSIIQDKNVNVFVDGNLKVGNLFYKRNIPVSLKQNIPLSK